jgi:hypothetical protein
VRQLKPHKNYGALGVGIVALTLVVLIGVRLVSGIATEEPVWEAEAYEPEQRDDLSIISDEAPRLVVRGIETQHTEVVVDGQTFFSGRLSSGQSVEPPAGRIVSVQIPDLTRVTVIYNGTRVRPLGKLTSGRKLVFVNESQ